jgi:predicted  nucleic acid-binding Zn-ribbon protein
MDLQDYPRPKHDNGRGIHWFPTLGQRRPIVDQNVARLVDLKLRWLVLWNGLDDAALLVNDHLIKKLVAAGIAPIMHVYLRPIAPLDDAALTRLHRLVAYYRDPLRRVDYFQLFYEPNVADEWTQGQMPAEPVQAFLDAWLPAAQEVINAGGLPGFAPLWQGGEYDDQKFLSEGLTAILQRGQQSILDKAWIAVHNYNLPGNLGGPVAGNLAGNSGGPVAGNLAGNSGGPVAGNLPGNLGETVAGNGASDAEGNADGFDRFAWVDRTVTGILGRALPILTTEGGTRPGEPPYGDGASETQVTADTVAAYERLKTAPDSYFCYCPWLFGNLLGGGDEPAWEPMAWFRGDGGQQPVVEAVRQLEDFPRRPPSVEQPIQQAPGERFFEETQHWVRGAFLEFFTRYGLDLCGFPLGEAAVENGLPTQYFQKLVMEEYWPGRIRLRPVGEEVVDLRVQLGRLQEQGMAGPGPLVPTGEAVVASPQNADSAPAVSAAQANEVGRLREERDQLAKQVAALQVGGASGELASVAAAEIYKLQARVEEQEKALAAAREAVDADGIELRRQAAQAMADRDRLAARLQDLNGRIVNGEVYEIVSREAIQVADLVKEQETRLASADTKIAQLEKERGQLTRQVKPLEKQVATLQAQIAAAQAQVAAAQAQPALTEAEARELRDRLAALESQLTSAQDQIKQLEAGKAQLVGQNEELQTTLRQALAVPPPDPVEIHELRDRIAQLEAALADSQAAVQAMMTDKPMISQVMDKWKSAQQASAGGDSARVQALQARLTELEQELRRDEPQSRAADGRSTGQGALAAAESDLGRLRELRARVTELDAFVGASQAEIRRLKEHNKQRAS